MLRVAIRAPRAAIRTLLAALLLAAALPGTARAVAVAVTLNPDPVVPGEVLEIQVTVVNDGGAPRSDVSVSLVLPAGLSTLDELTMTDGASCAPTVSNNGACDPLETVVWTIGSLPAGAGRTFRLPPLVAPATAPGTVITVEAEVFDDSVEIASDSRSATVVAERRFDLELVESVDPVASTGTLVYEIHYGSPVASSLAPGTQLALELPPEVGFVSATGGGVHAAGTVTWALGTLQPGQGGVQRVAVSAAGAAEAALLLARARIVDTAPANQVRARAVTRVRSGEPLQLAIVATPDPVRPNEAQDLELVVSNTSGAPILDAFVELVIPQQAVVFAEEIASGAPVCPAGVSNNGSCDPRERLIWSLGTIAPGSGRTLRLAPRIAAALPDGRTVRWRASADGVVGGTFSAVEADAAALVRAAPALELAVVESVEPVAAGGVLTYAVSFGHPATASLAPGAQLELVLPPGVTFASATDGGVHGVGVVTWALGTLQPGQGGVRHATVTVAGATGAATLLPARARIFDTAATPSEARARAVTRVGSGSPLVFGLVASPDPMAPGAQLDVELVVANRGAVPLFETAVELVVPERIAVFAEEVASGDPVCIAGVSNNGSCDPRERLVWTIGTLAPGTGRTLRLSPAVAAAVADGRLIGWRAAASGLDGALRQHAEAGAVGIVRAAPRLDLALVESTEPVAAGAPLTYAVSFGHLATASLAPDARLELVLPPGTVLTGAADGGTLAGGVVSWPLGTLQPGDGGVRSATVTVAGGAEAGSLLAARARIVDASATPIEARAGALTRVRNDVPLQLAIVASPDPVPPGVRQTVEIVASNRGAFPIFDTVVELVVPEEIANFSPSIANASPTCPAGVSNNGACDARERVVWSVGPIAPGTGRTLRLAPRVAPATAEAAQIVWRAAARGLDGTIVEAAEAGTAAIVEAAPRFDLTLLPSAQPAAPGGPLTWLLRFGHRGATPLPAGTRLELLLPPGVVANGAPGGMAHWWVGPLAPGQSRTRQIKVSALPNLPQGSLLTARARITGPSIADQARAAAVTRLRSQAPVALQVLLPTAPVAPGQVVDAKLRVTNTTAFPLFAVAVEAIVPEGVVPFPNAQTDGGTCVQAVSNNGVCDPGERIVWNLASIAAGATIELDLTFTMAGGGAALADGEVLALQALVEGGEEQASGLAVKAIPEPGGLLAALAALLALGALASRSGSTARQR